MFNSIRSRKNYILFLIAVLLFQGTVSFAQESGYGDIVIIVSTAAAEEDSYYSFRDVINNAVSVELKVAGLKAVISEYSAEAMDDAYTSGAAFLMENDYTIQSKTIKVNFKCYRTDSESLLYSVSKTGKLDLELDGIIQEAAREIIPRIRQSLTDIPFVPRESSPQTAEAGSGRETNGPAGIKSAGDVSAVNGRETNGPAGDMSETDRAVSNGPAAAGKTGKKSEPEETFQQGKGTSAPGSFQSREGTADNSGAFMMSTGFSPFLTTGEASGYFTLGLSPEICAGYRFPRPGGYMVLGLSGSANYFIAEGVLLSSENFLISAGPELRYGIESNSSLGIIWRVSGGAALFMMNKNNEGFQSAVIPYASGGMGMTLKWGLGVGIQLTANYTVYVESSVLITGFSPSVGVFFLL